MSNTIMLVGLGDLGYHILNFMALTPGVGRVVAVDVNESLGAAKAHHATWIAAFQNRYPQIDFVTLGLGAVDEVANLLKIVQPKVICSTAVLWPSYLRPPISEEKRRKLESEGYRGEAPLMSTTLYCPLKLMQATRKSGIDSHVIISNYPDCTSPVLAKGFGLAPTCGAGNLDNVTPLIKEIVSQKLKVPMRNIILFLVAHHAWGYYLKSGIPYRLKIISGGDDVTSQFPPEKLLPEIRERKGKYGLPGPLGESARYHQAFIASSFLKNILALYFDTGELSHSPGPVGLPGGYPVRLSGKGCEVYLPKEVTLDEAVKINEDGQKFDGIEGIEKNGTIVRTDGSVLEARDIEDTAMKVLAILKGG